MRDLLKQTKQQRRDFIEAANTQDHVDVSVFKLYKLYILREHAIH